MTYKNNKTLKSSNSITLDSAEWYMETQFNVEEARTEETYKLIYQDSTFYTMELNGSGLVTYDAMNNIYNDILGDLDSIEYVISNADVIPVYGNLVVISSNNVSAELVLYWGFGTYYNGNYAPFYYIDDWYYGNVLGRTDGAYLWESDAGIELNNRLNNPYFQYFQPGSYVSPMEYVGIRYNEYPDVNDLNPESNVDYLTYYEESTEYPSPELENEELTFYRENLHNIIYTYDDKIVPRSDSAGKRPYGLAFEKLVTWTETDTINNMYYYEHGHTVTYATRVNITTIPD